MRSLALVAALAGDPRPSPLPDDAAPESGAPAALDIAPAPRADPRPATPGGDPEGDRDEGDEGDVLAAAPRRPTLDPAILERRPRTTRKRHLLLPLPTVRTEPLIGLMLGLRLTYAYRPQEGAPNRIFLAVNARASLLGVHDHGFTLNLHDFLRRGEVFALGFAAQLNPISPYYGFRPDLALDDASIDAPEYLSRVDTYAAFFDYQHPLWRWRPPGPGRVAGALRGLLGLAYAVDSIRADPGALLAQEQPDALGLTRRGTLRAGVVWDRRDNEWSPRWGALHSATAEIGGPWTLSSTGTWARVNATARWYRPLFTRDFILANQIAVDALLGDAPFVPLGQIGVLAPVDAFGGRDVGRGYIRRRFIGRHKAIYSIEVRFEPVEVKAGRHVLGAGFKLFADVGLVLQPGQPRPPGARVAGGPGVYVAVDRFSIVRLDAGFSPETTAFYVTGEHTF